MMKIIYDIDEMQKVGKIRDGSLGFVPTMGALHEGHASLIKQARQQNDAVVVSIFVNPTQFNQQEDFLNYPKTIKNDEAYLQHLDVDYLFLPTQESIYPFKKKCMVTSQHQYMLTLEGASRPGHFDGVLTVVLKLLNIVSPDTAYFGEKDYQQYVLIKSMAEDLFLKTRIVGVKTVREKSGLALSSRNLRLSKEEKLLAEEVAALIHQTTERNVEQIKSSLQHLDVQLDYLEFVDGRVFTAFYINGIRLIDNFDLTEKLAC